MSQDLAGRTISHVEDMSEYGGTRLHFTDGTYAELEGGGYETSDVTVQHFTHEQHRRRAAQEQGARERRRVQRLTQRPSKTPLPAIGPIVKDIWTRPDPFQGPHALLDMIRSTPSTAPRIRVSLGAIGLARVSG